MTETDVAVVRELLDAFNRGDYEASTQMLHGRGRGSGIEIEQEIFQVYEVRERRSYRCWVYWDEDRARAAAGL